MEGESIVLKERNHLTVRQVVAVEGFDESKILLKTKLGKLEIKGENLEITSLDLEHNQIIAQGKIGSMIYLEQRSEKIKKKSKSTMQRLLH